MIGRTTALAALVVAVAGSALTAPSAHAAAPSVIGGTAGSALAAAAVYVDTDDNDCTGALWLPNVVVTAADCIVGESVPDIQVTGPGNNLNSPAIVSDVQQAIFEPTYASTSGYGDDVAFLILVTPLGTPITTRLATQSEAMALSASPTTQFQFAGYGQTAPDSDQSAPLSPLPLGMTTVAAAPAYGGGTGVVNLSINGVTAPCDGDEGGPWMVQTGDEVLLIGPDVGGWGGPCYPQDQGHGEQAAMASGEPGLVAQALAAANVSPPPPPTTCITVPGTAQSCLPGVSWTYDYCWAVPHVLVQQQSGSAWATIGTVTGTSGTGCSGKTPYLIRYAGQNSPGTGTYRILAPSQAGYAQQTRTFTVTTTA